MQFGDIYKSLNRTQLFPSIYNFVLGRKLGKIGQQENPKDSPYVPLQDQSQQNINELYTPPGEGRPSDTIVNTPPVDSTPVDTNLSGAGDKGPSVQQNKVFVPNIRVNDTKTNKGPNTQQNFSNVKLSTDPTDVDIPNSDYNKKLRKEILDYVAYASRFGQHGTPFINEAVNTTLPLLQETAPEIPKFNKDQYFTDANGKTWYAPTGNNEALVPVLTNDGSQLSTKLPEFDKARMTVTVDDNGNAVLFNQQSGERKETGVPIEQFDYKYGLDSEQFDFDKAYKSALLQIKQNKSNRNGRGNGDGDGTSNGFGNSPSDGLILRDKKTGQPLKLAWSIDEETGQKKQVVQLPNGQWMNWSEIEGTVNKLNSKKESKEAVWQLENFGIEPLTPKHKDYKETSKRKNRRDILKQVLPNLFNDNTDVNSLSDENINNALIQHWNSINPVQQQLIEEYFKTEKK